MDRREELICKMCNAYSEALPGDGMASMDAIKAALKVVLDEVLREPTQEEYLRHEKLWGHQCGDTVIRDFLAARRQRFKEEPLDPAIKAVDKLLHATRPFQLTAYEIIAAVDAARGKERA